MTQYTFGFTSHTIEAPSGVSQPPVTYDIWQPPTRPFDYKQDAPEIELPIDFSLIEVTLPNGRRSVSHVDIWWDPITRRFANHE